MKSFLIKNRGRLTAALLIIMLLAAAWFYGDGSGKNKKSEAALPGASDFVMDNGEADGKEAETTPGTEQKTETESSERDIPAGTITETVKPDETPAPAELTPADTDPTDTDPTGTEPIPTESATPAITDSPGGDKVPETTQTPEEPTKPVTITPAKETVSPTKPVTITPAKETVSPTKPITITPPKETASPEKPISPTPTSEADKGQYSCTVSIECKTILPKLSGMNPKLRKLIPEDGVILEGETVYFDEGDTVFDVLKKVCRENDISLEYNYVPAFKTVYIEGIADLYEFDGGNLSGWQYSVNGEFVMLGCSAKTVSDGDVVSWRYTCDMGKDL